MNKKYKWIGLLILCIVFFGSIFCSNNKVHAALSSTAQDLIKRNYANSLKICYDGGAIKDDIDITPDDINQSSNTILINLLSKIRKINSF